jgi:dipeptidyl aminopeptidase/acylaminoacyl peptidase
VDFASGTGICLVLYSGQSLVNSVYIFGPEFHLRHTLPLGGLPSRARVSPDGRYAVFTVFVTGHSYADAGFSTQTLILDTTNGNIVANLEEFAVTKSGARFQAPDFNFWGVTFTQDSNRFYATLSSRNRIYLVEGDVGTKTAHVLREDVECPSLSPDNQRLAFKRRVPAGTGFRWEIHLLDLASGEERALTAERRNVDDQVEWYDNEHLLYALPDDGPSATPGENVWMLPTDGAPPQLYLQKASSPAVVREARSTALLP